jgi:WD40 repeat protein
MKVDPTKTHEAQKFSHSAPFLAAQFDPRGRFIFASAQDFTVQRIELASGAKTAMKGHESWLRAIAFSPDGATTYTGGYDGRLIWWETAAKEPKPMRTALAHDGWVRSVAVSPSGELLATCGNDQLVKLWNAADGALVRELKGHTRHVYNVAFHPSGEQLASCDLMGMIKHWNVADGKAARELKAADLHKYDATFGADIGGARCLAFSPDGKFLAAGGITNVTNAFAGVGNPAIVVLDWAKGEKVQLHKPKENINCVAWGIEFHPDGFMICAAGGGSGGFLYFYKPGQPNEFHQVRLPSPARDLSLHKDGIQLAVPHFDSTVRLWAMREKETAKKDAAKKNVVKKETPKKA